MKRISYVYLALLLAVSLLLTACGSTDTATGNETMNNEQPQVENSTGTTSQAPTDKNAEAPVLEFELNDTFQKLLDEVNTAHKAISFYNEDYSAYMGQNENPDFDPSICSFNPNAMPDINTVVTLEQVTADMDLYYEALRTNYGCYQYFGGDEIFRPAIDAVIADCAAMPTITVASWVKSIMTHLSFVEDGHFSVAGMQLGEYSVPFFFRSISFQKTEDGYVAQNGKVVASVDGFENLDDLFKLSLTKEGKLVYYPVVLEKFPSHQLKNGTVLSNTSLTVRFADESTQVLRADPYTHGSYATGEANALVCEENGIPVITVNQFEAANGGMHFTDSAFRYRNRDIVLVDLRTNQGGNINMVSQWFTDYTQREVWAHSMNLVLGEPNLVYEKYHDKVEDEFVPRDNVLVVLTSKLTASSGDDFVDLAHNLENTLLVGENTNGALIANRLEWTLPNTGLFVTFGNTLYLLPEGYFEEYRGFYPDIWVPAAEAEEAVMNFIAKNAAKQIQS